MTTLLKFIAIKSSLGSQWKNIPVNDVISKNIYELINSYSEIYIEVEKQDKSTYYTELTYLKKIRLSLKGTLQEVLDNESIVNFPVLKSIPDYEEDAVIYSDAVRCEYKINLITIGHNYPVGYPSSEHSDLIITRPNKRIDLTLLDTHCLITVNGFIHNTFSVVDDTKKIYVLDGGSSIGKNNENHIGILSFLHLGKINKINILEDDITLKEVKNIIPLRDADKEDIFNLYPPITGLDGPDTYSVKFNIPNTEDTLNKSFILILGGYIIPITKDIFIKTGSHTFLLHLNNLPLLERYYESKQYINIEDYVTEQNDVDDVLYEERIYKNIKKLFLMSQSFLVIIDGGDLKTELISLRTSNIPDKYISHIKPKYPLLAGYGRIAEYIDMYDDDSWSVNTHKATTNNYLVDKVYKHKPINKIIHSKSIDPLVPSVKKNNSKVSFLKIYK